MPPGLPLSMNSLILPIFPHGVLLDVSSYDLVAVARFVVAAVAHETLCCCVLGPKRLFVGHVPIVNDDKASD